jgi:hypothetical protein
MPCTANDNRYGKNAWFLMEMIDYGGIRLVVKRTLRLTGQQANGPTGQGNRK